MNSTNEVMTTPFQQVALALSLIRGPKVDGWVDAQAVTLDEKVTCQVQPIAQTDEALWTKFKRDFVAAFTDIAKEQDAYHKLSNLTMQGSDINSYIAAFNYYLNQAGWSPTDRGSLERFK
jgi:hypothetical protein